MEQRSDSTVLPSAALPAARQPKLLDRLRIHLRTRHYSIRTEEAYTDWVRRFILYHGKRHPQDMGALEVEAFLSHLAVDRQVSVFTQNQVKAALCLRVLPRAPSHAGWRRKKGRLQRLSTVAGAARWPRASARQAQTPRHAPPPVHRRAGKTPARPWHR